MTGGACKVWWRYLSSFLVMGRKVEGGRFTPSIGAPSVISCGGDCHETPIVEIGELKVHTHGEMALLDSILTLNYT